MKNWLNVFFVAIAAAAGYVLAVNNLSENRPPYFAETLANARYVELTHVMHEGIPDGPGPEEASIGMLLSHIEGEGVMSGTGSIHHYSFPGQWRTHVVPPIDFIEGGEH